MSSVRLSSRRRREAYLDRGALSRSRNIRVEIPCSCSAEPRSGASMGGAARSAGVFARNQTRRRIDTLMEVVAHRQAPDCTRSGVRTATCPAFRSSGLHGHAHIASSGGLLVDGLAASIGPSIVRPWRRKRQGPRSARQSRTMEIDGIQALPLRIDAPAKRSRSSWCSQVAHNPTSGGRVHGNDGWD